MGKLVETRNAVTDHAFFTPAPQALSFLNRSFKRTNTASVLSFFRPSEIGIYINLRREWNKHTVTRHDKLFSHLQYNKNIYITRMYYIIVICNMLTITCNVYHIAFNKFYGSQMGYSLHLAEKSPKTRRLRPPFNRQTRFSFFDFSRQ